MPKGGAQAHVVELRHWGEGALKARHAFDAASSTTGVGSSGRSAAGTVLKIPTAAPVQEAPKQIPTQAIALRCVSVTDARGFAALEQRWRDVLAHSSAPSAFHSWEFVHEWWRHFVLGRVGGATGEYEVVVVSTSDGLPAAILPFFIENNLGRPSLGTILQPLGRSNSFDPMTDLPVAVYRAGFEARALDAVRSHLLRRVRRWDVAALDAPPSSNPPAASPMRRSDVPDVVEVRRIHDGPLTLALPRSWSAYRATLTKSMRDNLAYYPRRLSRDRPNWRVRAVRSPGAIAAATDALIRLHWNRTAFRVGSPHGSHIRSEQHASFLHHWFRRAAEQDQVAIYTLEVDGQVVAAQAFVESSGCTAVYFSGYDEQFYRHSPLMILTAEAIRDAIARGLDCVEFPPTPKLWKSRWGALQDRPIAQTSFYSSRPQALLRGLFRRVYFRALTYQQDRLAPVQA